MRDNNIRHETKIEKCSRCDGRGWNSVCNDDFEDMGFKRGCRDCGGSGATRIPLVSTFSTLVKGSGKVEVMYQVDVETGKRTEISSKPKKSWF